MTTRTQLAAIATKHGLAAPADPPVPWTGATSRVYPLGNAVVKIPFDESAAIQALLTDAAMVPFARALGIDAPEIIAADETGDIVAVPFIISRRVAGAVPLDPAGRSDRARAAWHEVGRQLARVHAVKDPTAAPMPLRTFRQTPDVDPRPWVDELRAVGALSGEDARWLHALLERLAPTALATAVLALCHGDINAANILVDRETGHVRALIDWAGAGWLDPVWDFAGVPLDVVPWLLASHRQIAPLPDDDTAESRILWCQIQTRLHAVRSASGPAASSVDIDQIRRFASLVGIAP